MGMNGSHGCKEMWMYLLPKNYTFKIVKMSNFVLYILSQEKQEIK